MQAQGKKLGQEVSIKSLKESFKENCNMCKCYRTTKKRVHSGKARDGPRHGGESAKGPGERARLKASRHGYNQLKN